MSALRRGACPELARPMPTGDGLLARLHLAGPVARDALIALCRAARRCGNGLLEVSQRGSLQVRGLRPDTVDPFAAAVGRLAIAAPDGFVVHTAPLAGRLAPEAWDPLALAAALREAGEVFAGRLSPKFSIVVDAGGGLPLDGLGADLRLVAQGTEIAIGLGVAPLWIGRVPVAGVLDAVNGLLRRIAAEGPGARAAAADLAALASGCAPMPAPPPRPALHPVGTHRLIDGGVARGLGLPFGQVDATLLEALLGTLPEAALVWAAPDRAVVIEGLDTADLPALESAARALDLVLSAGDPRTAIAVCAGAPACASAHQPVRALAATLAESVPSLLDGSARIHLSGCAKGCAHPAPAPLALVGTEAGFAVVLDGRADAAPIATLSPGAVPAAIARIAAMRVPGESAATCLHRIATGAAGMPIWHEARHG